MTQDTWFLVWISASLTNLQLFGGIAGFNVVQRPVCITDITTAIEYRMCWSNLISPMLAGNAVNYLTSDYRLRIS